MGLLSLCLSLKPCSNRRHSVLLTIKWDGLYHNILPSGPRVFLLYLNIDIHSTQPLHHVALCDKMYVSLNCTETVLTEAAAEGKTNCQNPFIHTAVFKFYRVIFVPSDVLLIIPLPPLKTPQPPPTTGWTSEAVGGKHTSEKAEGGGFSSISTLFQTTFYATFYGFF